MFKAHVDKNDNTVTRVGDGCVISLEETELPTLKIEGPYGSPIQV